MLTLITGKGEVQEIRRQEAQDLEGQRHQANTELDHLIAWQVVAGVILAVGGALTWVWLN